MKRVVAMVVVIFGILSGVLIADEAKKINEDGSFLEEFLSEFKISGKFNVISKIQKSFTTPLDNPDFGLYDRAGANYRSSQNFRTRAQVNLSCGEPGKSEWFGVVTLRLDANDPDTDKKNGEGDVEFVGVENFFIMYRPFELNGGRPFGVSVGIQSVKATANAAYGYYYAGDIDEDFVFYTAAAASRLPMINFDFHIDANTGIGFAVIKGAGDISRIGTGMRSESALNKTIWMEFKRWNIGINAAYQMIGGEGGGTKLTETGEGNVIKEYNPQYKHTMFNGLFSYTYKGITPYIGYQIIQGDNVPTTETADLPIREIFGSFLTYGAKWEFDLFGVKNTIAGDYTISNTDKFDGLNGLPKDVVYYNMLKTAGTTNDISSYAEPMKDRGGRSKVAYAIAKLDAAMHFEYAVQIKEKLKMSFFYYELMGKKDETMSDGYVRQNIIDALASEFGVSAATLIANGVMGGGLSTQMEALRKFSEWSSSNSMGIVLSYSF